MQGQADLFLGLVETVAPVRKPTPSDIRVEPRRQAPALRLGPDDFELAADALEASGQYRILRRLQPRPVVTSRFAVPGEKLAVIVDTETRGLDHTRDEVIEIGMVAFTYDEDDSINSLSYARPLSSRFILLGVGHQPLRMQTLLQKEASLSLVREAGEIALTKLADGPAPVGTQS